MSWPVVDRTSVQLPTLPGHDDALWTTLIELSEVRPGDWRSSSTCSHPTDSDLGPT